MLEEILLTQLRMFDLCGSNETPSHTRSVEVTEKDLRRMHEFSRGTHFPFIYFNLVGPFLLVQVES